MKNRINSTTLLLISLSSFLTGPGLMAMAASTSETAAGTCTFTSRNYAVGDVWYPRLGQREALHCVACICQEGGKINCTIHECGGQECSSPELAANNKCCAHCSKETTFSTRAFHPESVIPVSSFSLSDLSGGGSSTSSGAAVTCLHNGNVYRHKERFTSANVGLKPEHADQCVQCSCEGGMVMCQLKDCPKADCDNPIRTKDDCCPVCPDPAGRVDEMDNSPVIIQQQPEGTGNSKLENCISGGRYYLHGTTWHPVMGPFGPMDCVNCKCKSGKIECQRLECPSRPALNCDRPVKVTGRCCPVCPLEGDIQEGPMTPLLSSSPVSAAGTRSNIQRTSSMAGSGGRTSKSPSGRPSLSPPSSSALIKSSTHHGNFSLCLPRDYDVIVYRAQGGGSTSEFIQYIFQQVVDGQAIEHHMWMLQPTVTTYKVQDLTRDQSEALRQRFRFVLLGATATKYVKRFSKREKKLKAKCLPDSGCPKKIRRLERNLALKEVTSRRGCYAIEVEANTH